VLRVHTVLCKTAEPIVSQFGADSCGPREPCIGWGFRSHGKEHQQCGLLLYYLGTRVVPEKGPLKGCVCVVTVRCLSAKSHYCTGLCTAVLVVLVETTELMFVLQVFPEILHEVQSKLSQKRRKSA